jgi:hypothetical protein
MFSEGQKRRASLNILEKLRSQGVPPSEKGDSGEEFDSMFAKLDEEGKVTTGGEAEVPPEEKKKKKKAYERGDGETRQPAPNQPAAKAFMEAFKKTK